MLGYCEIISPQAYALNGTFKEHSPCSVKLGYGKTGRALVDTGMALARLGGVLISMEKKETQSFKVMTPILASGRQEC